MKLPPPPPPPPAKLSPYQEKLCQFRAEGKKDHEIARAVGRSPGTVKNDFVKIRRFLAVPSEEEIFRAYWLTYQKAQKRDQPPVTSHSA